MKYEKLILNKFLPFQFSRIEYFEMDIVSDINIIIGSNGSGKTSLLNEIHPFATSSKLFSKDGYKEIHIEHNNNNYILSSNFNLSKIHSFKKNTIEMNESGLSTIQNELVSHHFGIEKTDRRITSNLYSFSNEAASNRNKILNTYSPYKMNKLFNIYNKLKQYIRTYKAQLKLIYDKKVNMENKMLKKEDSDKYLSEEKDNLNKLDEIINSINKISIEIGKLEHVDIHTVHKKNVDHISETILEISTLMNEIRYLPNEDIKTLNDNIIRNMAHEQVLENDLKSLIIKSNDINEKYKNLKKIEIIKEHKDELKIINNQISNLKPDILKRPLSKEDLLYLEKDIDSIKKFLDITTSLNIKFITLKKYNQRKNIYLSTLRNIENVNKEKLLYVKEFNSLQLKMKITPKDIPNTPCAKSKCPLYAEFMSEYNILNDRKDVIKKQIEYIDRKLKKYVDYKEVVSEYLSQYEPNITLIENFNKILKNYDITTKSIYDILNNKDYKILNEMEMYKNKNLITYKYQNLIKDKEKIEIKISGMEMSNTLNKDVLKKSIVEVNASIDNKRNHLKKLQSILKKNNDSLNNLTKYNDMSTKLKDIDVFVKDKIKYLNEGLYKIYLSDILNILENMKKDVLDKISSLRSILKEDDFINRVLREEIVPTEKKLLENIRKYEIMAKALSPESGIPYTLNKSFIDIIFNYINNSISNIFTYPIILKEVTDGEPIDYSKFKVLINNVEIDDISKLSLSQQAMIDMCFIISLINICKLNHLPLFLDEIGSSLDVMHQHKLSSFLSDYCNQGLICQLFLTNHTIYYKFIQNPTQK